MKAEELRIASPHSTITITPYSTTYEWHPDKYFEVTDTIIENRINRSKKVRARRFNNQNK